MNVAVEAEKKDSDAGRGWAVREVKKGCCPVCGAYRLSGGTGRHLYIRDKQIKKILEHKMAPKPKMKQKDLCASLAISAATYRTIVNLTVKNERDRLRIIEAAKEVGYIFPDSEQ